jgi:hypothetical protein
MDGSSRLSQAETWSIVIEPFVAAGNQYTDRLVRGDHPAIWTSYLGTIRS